MAFCGIGAARGQLLLALVLCCGPISKGNQSLLKTVENGTVPAVTLRGSALDAETGAPVNEKLKLQVFAQSGLVGSTQFTRDFTIGNLAPGMYTLEVTQEGNRFPVGKRVVGVFGAETAANVYVRLYGTLFGVVREPNGRPVANSRVLLVSREYWFGEATYYAEQHALTDDGGRY